jgi:hypothetical protein
MAKIRKVAGVTKKIDSFEEKSTYFANIFHIKKYGEIDIKKQAV